MNCLRYNEPNLSNTARIPYIILLMINDKEKYKQHGCIKYWYKLYHYWLDLYDCRYFCLVEHHRLCMVDTNIVEEQRGGHCECRAGHRSLPASSLLVSNIEVTEIMQGVSINELPFVILNLSKVYNHNILSFYSQHTFLCILRHGQDLYSHWACLMGSLRNYRLGKSQNQANSQRLTLH